MDWSLHRRARRRAVVWGSLAGISLLLVYAGVLAVANSLDHTFDELQRIWFWIVPIVGGLAFQVGLFTYVRSVTRPDPVGHAGGVVASGSASTLSMVACCAHHLTDVLPLIGLAGAAMFLATYQSLFLLLGVLSNVVGVVYTLGLIGRHGLFPTEPSLLTRSVNWPAQDALPYVIGGSVAVFAAVALIALTR